MRLLKLTFHVPFRSLPAGFSVDFQGFSKTVELTEFSPYCLVGPNGSGKSNILEALAAIFYHIECIYLDSKPDGFDKDKKHLRGFDATVAQPDSYELEYLIHDLSETELDRSSALIDSDGMTPFWHIHIRKEKGSRPAITGYKQGDLESSSQELDRTTVKRILPEFIVGYSSGENEVLSLPFFKMRFLHYDEYLSRLSKQFDFSRPEGRLIYLDNQFSQAVLLSNFLMQDTAVMQPVLDTVGIKRITQFQLIIQQNRHVPAQALDGELRAFADVAQAVDSSEVEPKEAYELTSLLNKTIEQLKRCATAWHFDPILEILTLDYWVNEATQQAFQWHFKRNPLTLFTAFQSLLNLNLYDTEQATKRDLYHSQSLYVNETIPTLPSDKRIARFKEVYVEKREENGFKHRILTKSLSDGEHQFLHSMGICLLLKNTNSLFLLDEPETHFDPDWRAQFISTLRKCLLADSSKLQVNELLITSHSPFIVSDCRTDHVLIFKHGRKEPARPDFNTFGASVNQISLKVFGKRETISEIAMNILKDLEQDVREGRRTPDEARDSTEMLGDSVEKMLFLRFVDQFQDSRGE